MLRYKDNISMEYLTMEDFNKHVEPIRGKMGKLRVICPEVEQPAIKKILQSSDIETSTAFMNAKTPQQQMAELPSESILKK